jgi:hypothetical protein
VVSKTFGLDRGYQEFFPSGNAMATPGTAIGRERVQSWLEARPEEPFFAYIHLREPHFPYNPPPPFDTRFGPDLLSRRPDDTAVVTISTERPLPGAAVRGGPRASPRPLPREPGVRRFPVGEVLSMLDPVHDRHRDRGPR